MKKSTSIKRWVAAISNNTKPFILKTTGEKHVGFNKKIGESVVIGDDVYCTVVGYRDGEVRLAFDAPQSIPFIVMKFKDVLSNAKRSMVQQCFQIRKVLLTV